MAITKSVSRYNTNALVLEKTVQRPTDEFVNPQGKVILAQPEKRKLTIVCYEDKTDDGIVDGVYLDVIVPKAIFDECKWLTRLKLKVERGDRGVVRAIPDSIIIDKPAPPKQTEIADTKKESR